MKTRFTHIRGNTTAITLTTMVLTAMLVSGCSVISSKDGAPDRQVNIHNIPDAQPRDEPLSRYGNPDSYTIDGERYYVLDSGKGFRQTGTASWYGTKFHGQRTSSGEVYDMYAMTAAHKTLPLPSYVKVTNLDNQRSIVVKVNDRGPFVDDRIIDLSYVAAHKLGIVGNGTAPVEIRTVDTSHNVIAAEDTSSQTENPATQSPTLESTDAEPYNFYYVQIGAFSDFVNAEQALAKLILETSQPAHISMGTVSTGTTAEKRTVYRVRLGPFQDHEQVKAVESQLEQYGYQYTHVSTE